MSNLIGSYFDEQAKIALDGLLDLIRTKLRERILEKIEPDIQVAINESLEAFRLSTTSYKDFGMGRDVLHLIVERKDKDDRRTDAGSSQGR